jgi:adenine-specific DNA-methyltransferase
MAPPIDVQAPPQNPAVGRKIFAGGRSRATKWVRADDDEAQLRNVRALCATVLDTYWSEMQTASDPLPLPPLIAPYETAALSGPAQSLAERLGHTAARSDPLEAGYQIGCLYTAILPKAYRSRYGVYYTPPALTRRLVAAATSAGVDWRHDTVLDPACGGGAFLAPVAQRMAAARSDASPEQILDHVAAHLRGYEIDAFGAWMSRVTLEAALLDVCRAAGRRLPNVVTVTDSLEHADESPAFDCVIGNPPYGKISLSSEQRAVYDRSLFGHANVYGLFTDLALRLSSETGRVAYVTPTSFLAGQYFKALRGLLGRTAPPVHVDFLSARKGVFEDVLQETLLAVYDKSADRDRTSPVHILTPEDTGDLHVEDGGTFCLPSDPTQPWILPRSPEQGRVVQGMQSMAHRLGDYGYDIRTGPLVWNRHKDRLRAEADDDTYPLIWAESVTPDGQFHFRAEKKNHEPYFAPAEDQDWLVVTTPCVLVQRTTAKEQHRRLIAAELPADFIRDHGGVVVENHLNMVVPTTDDPPVSVAALAALLNSAIVDQAFRCMSGSVAVSAYEMEALPLPPLDVMERIDAAVASGRSRETIDRILRDAYLSA